ncbi:unnamed protein product [Vicia faba]|uniref:Uncharacterized protein n=1 Tax=Vicia faba TaxID=3906 RepID=R4IUK6_VICFA|nr:hypothetical protein [Vicia faba]AGC79017.1 hypothetical protein [Vicia faba]CAI8608480.1 unnamed protein product [Vicia faba]
MLTNGGCGQYRSSQFKDGDLNPEEPSPFLFSKPMTLLFFQSTYPIPKKVIPLGSISPKRRYKALRIDPRKVINSRKPVQSLIQIDCPFFLCGFLCSAPTPGRGIPFALARFHSKADAALLTE